MPQGMNNSSDYLSKADEIGFGQLKLCYILAVYYLVKMYDHNSTHFVIPLYYDKL